MPTSLHAPSPAGDLHDPLMRAWWHDNVPATYWNPMIASSPQASLPADLRHVQDDLVARLNATTATLEGTTSRGLRLEAYRRTLTAWHDELASVSGRAMAGDTTTWYQPFLTMAPWNRPPLNTLFGVTDPKVLDRAFEQLCSTPNPAEGLAERASNVELQARALVKKFHLRLLMLDHTLAPLDQQVARLNQIERTLTEACAQLGIAHKAWGDVAPGLMSVNPTNGLLSDTSAAMYHGYYRCVSVRYDPQRLDPAYDGSPKHSLVHEWTHAFDHAVLQDQEIPGVESYEFASGFLARTTPAQRQAMNLPAHLDRSLGLLERIHQEMTGQVAPMMATGWLDRWLTQKAGQQWLKASRAHDEAHNARYYAQPHEMLARLVEYGDIPNNVRPTVAWLGQPRDIGLMGRNLGNGTVLAARLQTSPLRLFEELVRHMGLAAGPRDEASPVPVRTLGRVAPR